VRDYAAIRRVLILTMLLNWLATVAKLYVGYRSGTLAMTADGLDSFFDGFSNVAGLVAISVAAQPPDREHPYGHRKYETMVALGIAALLVVTTWELVRESFSRIQQPAAPTVTALSYAALIFGIVMQGGASLYELREGRRLHSELLIADARHSGANILMSVAVLVALPFMQRGYLLVDPILTLIVAVLIAHLGYEIVRDNFPVLVDRAPLDPDQIGRVAGSVDGVTSYHRIRSRGSSDEATIDLHVRVAPNLPMARADAIADQVRDRLLSEVSGVSDVTVHVEPQRQEQASAAEIYAAILRAASGRPVTIHEVWAFREPNEQTRAEAHIGVAPDLTVAAADDLVGQMEAEILAEVPWVSSLHTHIEPAFRDLVPGTAMAREQAGPLRTNVLAAASEVAGLSRPGNIAVFSTPEGLFLSLDVITQPDLSVSASHALAHILARNIRERLPEVIDVAVRVRPQPLEQP
jgi:cation diffusion facilitator family transporter